MPSRKAVVLARGLGTRMRRAAPDVALSPAERELADRGLKAMLSVGRPFLDHVLASLADAGLARVGLVIGPEHDVVRTRYTRDAVPTRIAVDFLIQPEPLGTADAVRAAREFVGDETFLVVNADNLYPPGALRALAALDGPGLIGYERETLIAEGNFEPERIARFALIEVAPDGTLARIVEKPDAAVAAALGATALVSMNSWVLSPAIFEACDRIGRSPRGELELQDAVRVAIEELGVKFRVLPWRGGGLDLSSRTDLASVTERLGAKEIQL